MVCALECVEIGELAFCGFIYLRWTPGLIYTSVRLICKVRTLICTT